MTPAELLPHFRLVKRVKPNEWTADCPSHQSQSRKSLSITLADDRWLVHCFAGCPVDAVIQAAGLTAVDLFVEPASSPPRIIATYRYEDEAGVLLYEALRYAPKDFRQRRPRPDGQGWINNVEGVRRVLYRLPHLAEQRCVWIVEGEKDADALAGLGLASTTTAQGASAWRPEYGYGDQLAALAPEEIVVLPDNDEAGEGYAAKIAADCLVRGLRIKIVRLPGLPHAGDVSDWLKSGGLRVGLERLAAETPALTVTPVAPEAVVHWAIEVEGILAGLGQPRATGLLTPYEGLNRYLAGGLMPGELVYLGAYPGVGKTALLLEFARGAAERGVSALVFSREMVNQAVARRLLAQGARVSAAGLKRGWLTDADMVQVAATWPKLRGLPIWLCQSAVTIDDLAREVAAFAGTPPLGLVLVDYLQLVRGGRVGAREGRRLEVEATSQGLKALALRHRVPVICASSLSRGPQPDPGKDRRPSINLLRESGELEHDADIILLLERPGDGDRATCRVAKNRDGETGVADLLFKAEWVAFLEASDREERR